MDAERFVLTAVVEGYLGISDVFDALKQVIVGPTSPRIVLVEPKKDSDKYLVVIEYQHTEGLELDSYIGDTVQFRRSKFQVKAVIA